MSEVIDPSDNIVITDPSDNVVITDPSDNVVITDPSDNVVITDPSDNVVITDPSDNVVITDPSDNVVITDPSDNVVITDPSDNVVITDPSDNVVITDPSDNVVITDPSDNVVIDPIPPTPPPISDSILTEWKITNLTVINQTANFQNLVIIATYKYTGTYTDLSGNVFTASISGDINLQEPDPTNYVPYDQLTEDIVLGWIIPQMNMTYLNSYIVNEISSQVLPTEIYNGLPWQTFKIR
jgi:hypothetical protein